MIREQRSKVANSRVFPYAFTMGAIRGMIRMVVAVCLFLAAAVPARAEDQPVRILLAQAPGLAEQIDGSTQGLYADTARELARKAGLEARILAVPGSELWQWLEQGKADMILAPQVGNAASARDLGPIHTVRTGIVMRKDRQKLRLRQLRGGQVAVIPGTGHDPGLNVRQKFAVIRDNDMIRAMKRLAAGEIECVAGPLPALDAAMKDMGTGRAMLGTPRELSRVQLHAFLQRNASPTLVDALTRAVGKRDASRPATSLSNDYLL